MTFNEVIPTYTEECFNVLNKLKFEVAGFDTVEHKVIAVRRDAKAAVLSDRVELVAKMNRKRVRFDLRKFGEGPNSLSEMVVRGHQSPVERSAAT